ncbi:MAG: hypothetical protein WC451_02575 [Patescibacteria group bacterium]
MIPGGTDDLEKFMDDVFCVWKEFHIQTYEYMMNMPFTRFDEMRKFVIKANKPPR